MASKSAHNVRGLRGSRHGRTRPSGVVGGRCRPQRPTNATRKKTSYATPRTRKEAARGGEPLTIYGDDYPTADGTAIRDYIHVLDLADAHIAALELTGSMEPSQEIANLGSGSGFSVKQVLDAANLIVGHEIPHSYGPRRAGDPPALIASNDRAEELLGWRPQRGSLDEMIGSAWALLQQDQAG